MITVAVALTAWAVWDALIIAVALAVLAWERRDDPDRHHFHLEDS